MQEPRRPFPLILDAAGLPAPRSMYVLKSHPKTGIVMVTKTAAASTLQNLEPNASLTTKQAITAEGDECSNGRTLPREHRQEPRPAAPGADGASLSSHTRDLVASHTEAPHLFRRRIFLQTTPSNYQVYTDDKNLSSKY